MNQRDLTDRQIQILMEVVDQELEANNELLGEIKDEATEEQTEYSNELIGIFELLRNGR